MKKLLNLQVLEAKNVLCVWREDIDDELYGFRCGIAHDTAEACYMIPRNIIVGTFDDGTVKAAGVQGLGTINEYGESEYDDLFLYHQFCYSVNLDIAKAFVRGKIETGEFNDEASAKATVVNDLQKAGVEIQDEALFFLSNATKASTGS